MITTALAAALAFALPAPPASPQGPPGMLKIEGGKVTVGTSLKEAEEMIRANKDAGAFIAGETPQQTMEVEDFYLMVTEVTNEQYAEFVRANEAKPPHLWGSQALDQARREHVTEQGRLAAEAVQRGERYTRVKFDDQNWWDKNWKTVEWKVPQEFLAHPVTYVDYRGALDYASWAGLRLMTEFEFYRAARGESDRRYPWGDEWRNGFASTLNGDRSGTSPVGSYPEGAVNGVYDLIGNVWEWTASPYVEFKGYDPVKVKMDRNRTIEAMAPFEPSARVLVGGAHSSEEMAARIATRMGTPRAQATDAVGFRCAASQAPGKDSAETLLADQIVLNVLPEDLNFDPTNAVVTRRWQTKPDVSSKIDHYAVISSYDQVLFVPADKITGGVLRDLEKQSLKEGPIHLGFLSTTIPLKEPELEPGTYHVAWRSAGKLEAPEDAEDALDWSTVKGFDEKQDLLIFLDLAAAPLVATQARPLLYDTINSRTRKGGVSIQPYEPPTDEQLKALEKAGKPAPIPMDTILLNLAIPGKHRSKGLIVDVAVKTDPSITPDSSWDQVK